ncbi:unnamed protein product [Dovyalis caffra]|uniref:Uncharacterized protein n=1 Tax=Dovyalis caffra TaxID=77055 RepID=A0AAV1QVS3_9ROSI|nr:unnamed protein product [Dovyalis caffra]
MRRRSTFKNNEGTPHVERSRAAHQNRSTEQVPKLAAIAQAIEEQLPSQSCECTYNQWSHREAVLEFGSAGESTIR